MCLSDIRDLNALRDTCTSSELESPEFSSSSEEYASVEACEDPGVYFSSEDEEPMSLFEVMAGPSSSRMRLL